MKRLCRVNRLVTGQIPHDTFTNLLDIWQRGTMLRPNLQTTDKSSRGTPARPKKKPRSNPMLQSRRTFCPQRQTINRNLPQLRSPSKNHPAATSPSIHSQNRFAAATRNEPDKMPRRKNDHLLYPRSYTPPLTGTEPMNIEHGFKRHGTGANPRTGRNHKSGGQVSHHPPASRRISNGSPTSALLDWSTSRELRITQASK